MFLDLTEIARYSAIMRRWLRNQPSCDGHLPPEAGNTAWEPFRLAPHKESHSRKFPSRQHTWQGKTRHATFMTSMPAEIADASAQELFARSRPIFDAEAFVAQKLRP
jgi:hypothetical protein